MLCLVVSRHSLSMSITVIASLLSKTGWPLRDCLCSLHYADSCAVAKTVFASKASKSSLAQAAGIHETILTAKWSVCEAQSSLIHFIIDMEPVGLRLTLSGWKSGPTLISHMHHCTGEFYLSKNGIKELSSTVTHFNWKFLPRKTQTLPDSFVLSFM